MNVPVRIALALLGALLLLAIAGPLLAPDPLAPTGTLTGLPLPPSAGHWLGTDVFMRDVFARLAAGARISLLVAGVAVTVAAASGLMIGLIAGASDGVVSQLARRVTDLALALPRVVVLLVVLAATGALAPAMMGLVIGLTGWPAIARLVQGEAIGLRGLLWVDASRALGARPLRVILREILPGTIPPVIVAATLGLADAMLLEAALSYIGLGVRPPWPTWGGMILDAGPWLATAPWLMLAPAVALGLATTAATLLGDGLRRSLQPGSS